MAGPGCNLGVSMEISLSFTPHHTNGPWIPGEACPDPRPLPNGLLIGLSALSLAPFSKADILWQCCQPDFPNLILSMADFDAEDHSCLSISRMRSNHGIKWSSHNLVQIFVPTFPDIFSIHIEYLAVPKDVDSSELLHVSPLLAGVPVSTSTKLRALPYDQLKHYILSEALPDAHQAMSHFLYYGGHSWPHLEPLWLYYYNYLCLCVTSIDPPPIHTRTSRADTISYAHITQHIN